MDNNNLNETSQKNNNKEQETLNNGENERTNADCLNSMANLNIIISIIGSIAIWVNFSTNKYHEVNWYGVISGIAVLIAGFTLFFLLKTVVDIYREVKNNE